MPSDRADAELLDVALVRSALQRSTLFGRARSPLPTALAVLANARHRASPKRSVGDVLQPLEPFSYSTPSAFMAAMAASRLKRPARAALVWGLRSVAHHGNEVEACRSRSPDRAVPTLQARTRLVEGEVLGQVYREGASTRGAASVEASALLDVPAPLGALRRLVHPRRRGLLGAPPPCVDERGEDLVCSSASGFELLLRRLHCLDEPAHAGSCRRRAPPWKVPSNW